MINLSHEQTDAQLEHFFRQPPDKGPGIHGQQRSILYVLRRDIRDASTREGRRTAVRRLRVPLMASFGIMVGYEILARIWTGKMDPGQKELRHIYHLMLGISKKKANLMVQFRNALAHGYQLKITDIKDKRKPTYSFTLGNRARRRSWFRASGGKYRVDFWELRWRFLRDVKRLHTTLMDHSQTGRRRMFLTALPHLEPYRMLVD